MLKGIISVIVLGALVISILMDLFIGVYTYCSFHIIMIFALIFYSFWMSSRLENKKRIILLIGIASIMFSIRYWDYNTQKPFLRRLNSLEKGMKRIEVIEHMCGYKLSGSNRGSSLDVSGMDSKEIESRTYTFIFTLTKEGWGDSDWGIVYFLDDKLYSTAFSMD